MLPCIIENEHYYMEEKKEKESEKMGKSDGGIMMLNN
jgi:hypothetical protein